MCIKFFVDENLGLNLVLGLRILGYLNIEHVTENFPAGTDDVTWLKYVGENGYVLITRDRKIRHNPKERTALLEHGIVTFFLGGKSPSTQEIVKQLINAWDSMEALAKRQQKTGVAGAFMIRPGGGKITSFPLP